MASTVPTTAGIPSSRLTMAACEVLPPWSVTMAAAIFMTGSQSGVVLTDTKTSPGRKVDSWPSSVMTRTFPDAILEPTLLPWLSTLLLDSRM